MTDQPKKRGRPKGSRNRTPEEKAAAQAEAAKTTEHDRVHIEDLNDEQHFALMMQHARKISEVEGRLEKIKKDVKAARDLARSELGKGALHEIKLYRELESEEGQQKLRAVADMQLRIARWAGMPTGHMDDLFPAEDREPIEDKTRADGKRAGLAGDDNAAPHHLDGLLKSKWQEGYNEGQAILMKGFKTAAPAGGFGVPPDAQDADPEKDGTYWMGQGRIAFENGHNGEPPDEIPVEHRDSWETGWKNASTAARHGKSQDHRADGAVARQRGDGCSIPTDLTKEQGAAWHLGWREKDAELRGASLEAA